MTEAISSNLVKIIAGVIVAVIVIAGLAMYFGNNIVDFFKNTPDFGTDNFQNDFPQGSVTLSNAKEYLVNYCSVHKDSTCPTFCENQNKFLIRIFSDCQDISDKWIEYSNNHNDFQLIIKCSNDNEEGMCFTDYYLKN